MLLDMEEITKFIGVQSLVSIPLLYMLSVYTDRLRKRYYTPYVRKLMYIGPLAVLTIGSYNIRWKNDVKSFLV